MRSYREVATAVVRISAPLSFTLPLVALGYFLKPAAYLLMFSMLPVLCWALALVGYLVVGLVRRRPIVHLLVGLLSCYLALLSAGQVIYGTPRWVKANAESVVRALEGWKAIHGSYPQPSSVDAEFSPDLRTILNRAGCLLYQPKDSGYTLTCSGVVFTKCTLDSRTQHWSSWD